MNSAELVFNDLSVLAALPAGFPSPQDLITGYVQTLAELVARAGTAATLRASVWLDEVRLTDFSGAEYGFADWRGDRSVDRDTRTFFARLGSKVPVEAELGVEEEERLADSSYAIAGYPSGHEAWAAAVALVGGHVLTSLSTDAIWNASVVRLQSDHGSSGVSNVHEISEVPHASQPAHASHVSMQLRDRARSAIGLGGDSERGAQPPFLIWRFHLT